MSKDIKTSGAHSTMSEIMGQSVAQLMDEVADMRQNLLKTNEQLVGRYKENQDKLGQLTTQYNELMQECYDNYEITLEQLQEERRTQILRQSRRETQDSNLSPGNLGTNQLSRYSTRERHTALKDSLRDSLRDVTQSVTELRESRAAFDDKKRDISDQNNRVALATVAAFFIAFIVGHFVSKGN